MGTTWSFLVIFVQHRSILCNEAKASGVWEKCIEGNSLPASCSPQSFSQDMSMRTEKAWMPNITYKTGQVVYLEDTSSNRIKGETNIEFSVIYRLLIIVLNMMCISEAIFA